MKLEVGGSLFCSSSSTVSVIFLGVQKKGRQTLLLNKVFLRRFFFLTLLYTPPTPQPPTTKCKSPIGNLSQTIRNHTFTKGCLPPTVKIHNHSIKYPKTQRERERERERERIEEPVRSQKKLHEEGSSKSHHISLGFKLAVKPITTVKN
jgi:hypothetical protein